MYRQSNRKLPISVVLIALVVMVMSLGSGCFVTEANEAPQADFVAETTSGPTPLEVHFSDDSTGDIATWSWNFGNGATSTEQNPVHTYQEPGTYTVTLTVTAADGSDTKTKVNYISVTPLIPVLSSPDADSYTNDNTPLFDWTDVTGDSGITYNLQVDNDASFDSPVIDMTGLTNSQYPDSPSLPDGTYFWKVMAVEGDGNESAWSAPWSFTVDTVSPVVTVTSPNDGESWDGGSIHDITWTASDSNMADTPITIEYFNGTTWVEIVTDEADDGTYEWTLPYDLNTVIARVKVTAEDIEGNTGSDLSNADFTIDSSEPAAAVDSLDPNPTSNTTPTFFGQADDEVSPVVSAQYRVDDGAWTAATAVDGAFNSTFEQFTFTTSPLADGTHTVEVRATDAAGNVTAPENYASDTFDVDTGAPSVTLNALDPDPTNDNTPTFSGTAADAPSTWIASVEYRIDGGDWTTAQPTDGTFNEPSEGYTFTTSALADGTHTVEVRASDAAGNVTAPDNYASDIFDVDTLSPVVTVTSPNGGESWAGGSTQNITWTASDSNMANTPITIEYYNSTAWVGIVTDEADDGTYEWTLPSDLNTVTTRVKVTAEDIEGNTGSDLSDADFTIDSSEPAAAVDSLDPNPTSDTTPTFFGQANDGVSPVVSAQFRVDDGAWTAATAVDGTFDSTFEQFTFTTSPLADGTHTVEVRAIDEAGNITAEGHYGLTTFGVDTLSPAVTMTSPNGGENWDGGSIQNITWTASDADMADTPITIEYYNGTAWVEIVTGLANTGTYQWTVPVMQISQARVKVTATDKLGNSGSDLSYDVFTIIAYTLTVDVNPGYGGFVTFSPPGGVYAPGTQVTLTAIPYSGNIFDHWSRDVPSGADRYDPTIVIVMDSDKTLIAYIDCGG